MKEVIHIQTRQVLTMEFRHISMDRMDGGGNLLDVIADVLTGNIIQFVGLQIKIATEICIHINLQATSRLEIF